MLEKYICEKAYIVGGTLMRRDAFLLVDFVVKLQQNSTCKQKIKQKSSYKISANGFYYILCF